MYDVDKTIVACRCTECGKDYTREFPAWMTYVPTEPRRCPECVPKEEK